MTQPPVIDAVVIGRNEGARLRLCLGSLGRQVRRVIYVDSGSPDGSMATAEAMGAEAVALDMGTPFTAARARNARLFALAADPPDFVQFVDGDCEMAPGWIGAAVHAFADHPRAVVVAGRRRERFPGASVYNRLCDREWNTPVGPARACGGDAMMRPGPLLAAGGYRDSLIAGEEPELCLRLIAAGGEVWRIGAEMTVHDAAITRLGQWWKRARRAGHAFAEGATLHDGHWRAETRRALIWGAGEPLVALTGVIWPPAAAILLAWPMQVLRLWRRDGDAALAFLDVLGKLPEAQGALSFHAGLLLRRRARIIEYK